MFSVRFFLLTEKTVAKKKNKQLKVYHIGRMRVLFNGSSNLVLEQNTRVL